MGQTHRIRRDGWTPERQLAFLDALAGTRNVTKAARAAGMSRESAHRLRNRCDDGLFALLWDRMLAPPPIESHTPPLTTGSSRACSAFIFGAKAVISHRSDRQLRKAGEGDRTWRL
jgi:hypothetical protein